MDHPGDGERFDEELAHERITNRDSNRDSLFLQAVLRHTTLSADTNVRVRNLSAGGMMAECPGQFQAGDPIEVEMRGVGLINGRIAWVAEGRIGIAFDQEIDPLRARKPVGQGTKGVPIPAPLPARRPSFRPR